MSNLLITLSRSFVFWFTWILIPLIMEIIPSIFGVLILIKKRIFKKTIPDTLPRYPEITIIIPVYNSADTLKNCIRSIYDSTYPNDCVSVMLVNNMTKDNSFNIFMECQQEFSGLSMQWLNAKQGKSKALNMALFNAEGKYIIHIDSDGELEKNAIKNMVLRFESDSNIHCMTGTILTNPDMIEDSENFMMKLFRRCEFYEYGQAFLAGRNFESELDSVFTLSGAFSAFRKSTILKTQLYNTDTVCEDTHVTFQVRKYLKQRVFLCENALFMVDPIESLNKMYTQRQRWQRGELEVAHMFLKDDMKIGKGFLTNFMVRYIIIDHTYAFPRMIWYFALFTLLCINYSVKIIVGSTTIVYALYIMSAFFYYLNILAFLKPFPEIRKYYMKKVYICLLLPLYNFYTFWIRFAGIINSIDSVGAWKTKDYVEEKQSFVDVIKSDFSFITVIIDELKKKINKVNRTK